MVTIHITNSTNTKQLDVIIETLILISADDGVLLVLVLSDQVNNVLIGLLEFHLVHALALVPVEERLPLVEGGELLAESLEHVLQGGRVGDERARERVFLAWVQDDRRLDVVGDPLNEVLALCLLDSLDAEVDLLGREGATVGDTRGEVLALAGVDLGEERLATPHLLGELGGGHLDVRSVVLGLDGGLGDGEEVETGEWHKVDSELSEPM